MLEQLTLLQYLTLERAFPLNIDSDIEKPINLPHLKCISLVGTVPEIANTLECITLPPSARLVAKICTLVELRSNAWRLIETLGAHAWGTGVSGASLETLVLTGHESGSRFGQDFDSNLKFRQSLRIRAFSADWEGGVANLDLTIAPEEQDASGDEEMIMALTAILKALSLVQIHTLALKDVDIVTQKSWTAFLRTLPSLRVLDITGRAPSGLAWALLLNARSHGQGLKGEPGESQRPILPRLNDIYLHNVDCSSGGFMVSPAQSAPVNSHCDLDDSRFLDVLIASLNHRRKFGLCARSLSIARCTYALRSVVEDARAAVKYLICDLRNLMEKEVDPRFPARYSNCWDGRDLGGTRFHHYHRLRTLIEIDSEN